MRHRGSDQKKLLRRGQVLRAQVTDLPDTSPIRSNTRATSARSLPQGAGIHRWSTGSGRGDAPPEAGALPAVHEEGGRVAPESSGEAAASRVLERCPRGRCPSGALPRSPPGLLLPDSRYKPDDRTSSPSGSSNRCRSSCSAKGLRQVLPAHARKLGGLLRHRPRESPPRPAAAVVGGQRALPEVERGPGRGAKRSERGHGGGAFPASNFRNDAPAITGLLPGAPPGPDSAI